MTAAKVFAALVPVVALCFAVYYVTTVLGGRAEVTGMALFFAAIITPLILFQLVKTFAISAPSATDEKFEGQEGPPTLRTAFNRNAAFAILLVIGYAMLLNLFSFLIATLAFSLASILTFRDFKARYAILVGVALTALTYVLFIVLLDLRI